MSYNLLEQIYGKNPRRDESDLLVNNFTINIYYVMRNL